MNSTLIVAGRHSDPHRVLGRHDGVVRAYQPEAKAMRLLAETKSGGKTREMARVHPGGVFEAPIGKGIKRYQLEADYDQAGTVATYRFDDAYRSWPTLGELDLHLFGEGRHRRLWDVLGAHPREHDGMAGVSFAVWAPNAKAVRVVGDWNFWDGRVHQMRSLGSSGVWELFIPGIGAGARYKYELIAADGRLILKTDPMAFLMEQPPATASVVVDHTDYDWGDGAWIERRARSDGLRSPMAIYEMHLGSWRFTDGDSGERKPLSYRRAGRAASPISGRHGLHPRGIHARRRAPLQRIVGIPGVGVLRADFPLRRTRRLPGSGQLPPPKRNRCHRRLGARPLPA